MSLVLSLFFFCIDTSTTELYTYCHPLSRHDALPISVPALAERFFADEYRLVHRLHHYPKPLICWGHGYVMGGGMGLLQSATIRIVRSEEHTSELQSLMRISYAVFCLKKKKPREK